MLFCILLLGILGSGFCYVTWNYATKWLGIVTTNNYIYLNPFVTLLAAGLLLKEPVTIMGIAGSVFIVGGIVLADKYGKGKGKEIIETSSAPVDSVSE
jgi:drug/metabolite transporter (DMT)-like permease